MLDPFIDSSLRAESTDNHRVRLLGEITERRLWIAAEPLTRRMADLCLLGGALAGTVLIAGPEKRSAGRVVDAVGRS